MTDDERREHAADPATLIYRRCVVSWPELELEYSTGGARHVIGLRLHGLEHPHPSCDPAVIQRLAAWVGLSYVIDLFELRDFDCVVVEALAMAPVTRRAMARSLQRRLAEWRYVNGLDVGKHVCVVCEDEAAPEPAIAAPSRRVLLLNGGGKDTVVAAETLRAIGEPFSWLTIGRDPRPTAAQQAIADAFGGHVIHLHKRIDRAGLAREGRHRAPGRVPLGNLSCLVAYAANFGYVVTANEYSANFGNLVADGVAINHQHGKTLRSERAARRFQHRRLVRGIRGFSIVAPLYELQIARLFARHPRHLAHIVSCNVGHRHGSWCRECPKCAFTYLALAAFLGPEQLVPVFGEDLFARDAIRRWVVHLTGPGPKPLECVGTRMESQLALARVLASPAWRERLGDALVRTFRYCTRDLSHDEARAEILDRVDRPHAMPERFAGRVMQHFRAALLDPAPDPALVVDHPATVREALHRLCQLGAALDELAAEVVASPEGNLLEAIASGRLAGALRLKVIEPDAWRSHELAAVLRARLSRGGSPPLEPLLRAWCRLRGESKAFAEALGQAWHELPLAELDPADWPAVVMLLELSPWLGQRMRPGPVPDAPGPAALRHLLPAQALAGAAAEVLACLSARRHDPAIRAGWWLALACSARAGLGAAALALVPDDTPIGEAEPLLVACPPRGLATSVVETAGRCRIDDVAALERVLRTHARHAPSAVAALLRPRLVAEPSCLVDHLESCRLLVDCDPDAAGWITDVTWAVPDEALATLRGAGTTDGFLCGLLRSGRVEAVVSMLERMPDAIGCGGALASMIARNAAVRPRLAVLLHARARTVEALAAATFHMLRLRDLGHDLHLEAIMARLHLDAPLPPEQRARLNEQLTRIVRLAPPEAVPGLVRRYIRPVDVGHVLLAAEQERVAHDIRSAALGSASEADVCRHLDPVLAATIPGLPWSILRFLGYVVSGVGPLDPGLRDVLRGRRRWLTMPKSGSFLSLPLTHPGVLIHRLDPAPALVWQAIALEPDDPLPVAPFLRLRLRDGCAEVRSRYCGMTYPDALDLCGMRSQLDFRVWVDLSLGPDAPPMLRLLCEVMRGHERIALELLRRGIEHGHPHPRNFTVELMDRQYLRRARAHGMTVNTAPYHPEHVSFDLRRAGEREGSDWRWEVVVRLIDLDQVRFVGRG